MKPGARVRTLAPGGQRITGTVLRPGSTHTVETLNQAEGESLATVVVRWDDPAFGTDTVPVAGLEALDGSAAS
jgi:hypothetical protein